MSDGELIAGCLLGKKESWDAFVERFSRLIYWSAQEALTTSPYRGRKDLIEEIFQDVFCKLLEKDELSRLREAASVRKFLIIMACHAAMDKTKSLSRQEKRSGEADSDSMLDLLPSLVKDPAEQLKSGERDAVIAGVLDALPPKDRACVELHYLDGKTHREIAEILGMEQEAVSTVIRRTRELLKEKFTRKRRLLE